MSSWARLPEAELAMVGSSSGRTVRAGTNESRARRSYALMLVPLVAFLAAFFAWPVAQVVILSVTDPAPGLQNYALLIRDESLHKMIWTTLRISMLTTIFTVLIGYWVAYVMAHAEGRRLAVMVACVMLPLWTSVAVQAFGWLMLLKSNGIVNGALLGLGMISRPLPLVRNEIGVLIGMTHFMLPVAVLTLVGNMRGIDPRLVQAANSLGASQWQAFRVVYLPETLPGVVGTATAVLVICLGFYGIPALLGGGKTIMIAEYVSVQILQVAKWGVPAMLSTVLLAAVAAVMLTLSRLVGLRRVLMAG